MAMLSITQAQALEIKISAKFTEEKRGGGGNFNLKHLVVVEAISLTLFSSVAPKQYMIFIYIFDLEK